MSVVLGALSGVAVAAGLVMVVFSFLPAPPAPPKLGGRPIGRRALERLRTWGIDPGGSAGSTGWPVWRWPTALAAALVVWLVSGWPVAGLIVAVVVIGLPLLLAGGRSATRAIDRAEAIEEWTRRLADILVVGVGLEQAITATVRTCPPAINGPVAQLASRLSARWPTEPALRAFADDLDDAVGDLVAATLILSARRRGPGLVKVLTAVAESLADEVAMRRKVEAERAKPRTTARAVTMITLGVTAFGSLNTTYLRPYGSVLGQLVLAGLAASFVGALTWLHALTQSGRPPRFLTPMPTSPHPNTTGATS